MVSLDLTLSYKARYFKLGALTAETKQVWFVLHGYGQLAQYFLQKFKVLEEQGICVIAAEGLSTFYLEDVQSRAQSGNTRVGASWMTKENRLADIENYLEYLNTLFQKEVGSNTTVPITVLGFSQGAATASRWIADGKVRFDRLVLWAGLLPPDMDKEHASQVLTGKEVDFVYGLSDPYLNDSRFAEMKSLAEQLHLSPRILSFEGGHEIHSPTLLKLSGL